MSEQKWIKSNRSRIDAGLIVNGYRVIADSIAKQTCVRSMNALEEDDQATNPEAAVLADRSIELTLLCSHKTARAVFHPDGTVSMTKHRHAGLFVDKRVDTVVWSENIVVGLRDLFGWARGVPEWEDENQGATTATLADEAWSIGQRRKWY